MKTIIVMRHAKAESESPNENDFDRRLKKKGILATKNVANNIHILGIIPDLIISSPATRAVGTAEVVSDFFQKKDIILICSYLYKRLSKFEEIIDNISEYKNDSNSVIIVGHNPAISYLLQQIHASTNLLLRTSCAVVFDFDVDNWNEVNVTNSVRRCIIERED